MQQQRIMKDYTIGRFRSALAPGVRLEQTIKYVSMLCPRNIAFGLYRFLIV